MAENLSLQNFDWDAYEAQKQGTKNEEEIQKYNNTLNAIKDNEVVEGTVVSINKREVVVNVGYKSDGIVPASEFRYNPDLKVGDKVEVYIKSLDTENQKVSLGYKKAEDNPWERLKNEYPIGSVFHAPVVSTTKFGAFVRILPGIDGLVHISEISRERVEKVTDVLNVGDEVDVKLIEVDFDKRRVGLSMKALQEDAE